MKFLKTTTYATVGGGPEPVMLYNLEETAAQTGLSREAIVKLCTEGNAPRHYLTGDAVDIYFDEQSLSELQQIPHNDEGEINVVH